MSTFQSQNCIHLYVFIFQVYMTQTHYEKLYQLSKEVFYSLDGIDEKFVSDLHQVTLQ